MPVYVDVSAYWPKDDQGTPRSVNSVWEDSKKNGFQIGRDTLSGAISGRLDRLYLSNLVKLAKLCAFWSGGAVSVADIIKESAE